MSDRILRYEKVHHEGKHSVFDFDLRGAINDELDRVIAERREEINDQVNHPAHYTSGKIECIDAIRAALGDDEKFLGYCEGNVIKYIWRHRHKGGLTDLEKAKWYLDLMISVKKEKKKKKKANIDKVTHVFGGQGSNGSEKTDGTLTD